MKVVASAEMGRWASALLWVRKGFRLGMAPSTPSTVAEKGSVQSKALHRHEERSKSISIRLVKSTVKRSSSIIMNLKRRDTNHQDEEPPSPAYSPRVVPCREVSEGRPHNSMLQSDRLTLTAEGIDNFFKRRKSLELEKQLLQMDSNDRLQSYVKAS